MTTLSVVNDPFTKENIDVIISRLSEGQKECILSLSDEWQSSGYNKLNADLLWARDIKFFPGSFEPLVECNHEPQQVVTPDYQHRLLPLGMLVKQRLESVEVT